MEDKKSIFRRLFEKYREIIMYCIFGGVTTVVSWLTFSICEAVFGLDLYWSGIVSWIIAVTVAFITNKLWVFESKSWKLKLVLVEGVAFYGGRILTGILEVIAVPALSDWGMDMSLFGVDALPAKMLVSVVIIILNYVLSKLF
ncbi:MAG: GtrA family protein, partial [Oscillospiraceae bacterium]